MASETIDIRIREDGSRVVQRSLNNIATSSQQAARGIANLQIVLNTTATTSHRTASALGGLWNALRGIAAVHVARKILETVDAFTQIQNKLRVVTESTEELTGVTEALFEVAQRTRSDFAATATLYSRLALSNEQLGLSQKELVRFTELINKAIIVSGATATEASAGLIQFSQSLASGRLQGDELRSVLEQLPVVADVIADGLGITRGQLRAFGADGKITSEQIIAAFRKAAKDIDDKFGKTIPTLSQAFTVVNNSLTRFAGRVDQATGFSRKLVEVMFDFTILLSDQGFFNSVVANLRAIGVVFNAISVAVGNLITNINALAAAMSGLVPPSLGTFLNDVRTKAIDGIAEGYSATRSTVRYILEDIEKIAGKSKILSDNIGLPSLNQLTEGLGKVNQPAVTPAGALSDKGFDPNSVPGAGGGAGGADKLANALERLLKTAQPISAAFLELRENEDVLTQAMRAGLITGEQKAELMERLTELAYEHLDPLGFMLKEMKRESDLLALDARQRDIASESIERLNKLKEAGYRITQETVDGITREVAALQRLQAVRQAADQIAMQGKAGLNALTIEVEGNNLALQNGSITLQQYSNNLRDIGLQILRLNLDAGTATFSDTILAGLGQVVEGYRGVAVELGDIFGNFFSSLVDGFSNVVGQIVTGQTTMKEGFHQLAQSILSDLIGALVKLGLQWIINATIGQALSSLAVAATTTEAGLVAAAWAPAAALASLATLGTNAAPASAAVAATLAFTKALAAAGGGGLGLAEGGFVSGSGTGTSDSIAARLSNGEFVVNAAATRQNRSLLEGINNGTNINRYARGGMVGSSSFSSSGNSSESSSAINVQIHNYSSAKVETQQLSEQDVLVLIRDEAPKVVAGQLREPNSRVSKALSQSTTASRKRS